MPSDRTAQAWMKTDRDGFATRYRQAREIGYLVTADTIIDIADAAPPFAFVLHLKDGAIVDAETRAVEGRGCYVATSKILCEVTTLTYQAEVNLTEKRQSTVNRYAMASDLPLVSGSSAAATMMRP